MRISIPHDYRSVKQWKGPLPEDMLAKLWTPGLMHERVMPDMHCEVGIFPMRLAFMSSTGSTLQPEPMELQGVLIKASMWSHLLLGSLAQCVHSSADHGNTARQGPCSHSGLPDTGQ